MDEPMTLTDQECWSFLREQEFGRLAFHLGEEVHIVPINYAVDHDPVTNASTLLFRTAEGSKLLGIVMNDDVAFEIDDFDADEHARSVVLRGRARKLEEDEEHRAETVRLRPWAGNLKFNVVEIEPLEVSGRRFELHRPWLHLIPDDDM